MGCAAGRVEAHRRRKHVRAFLTGKLVRNMRCMITLIFFNDFTKIESG